MSGQKLYHGRTKLIIRSVNHPDQSSVNVQTPIFSACTLMRMSLIQYTVNNVQKTTAFK